MAGKNYKVNQKKNESWNLKKHYGDWEITHQRKHMVSLYQILKSLIYCSNPIVSNKITPFPHAQYWNIHACIRNNNLEKEITENI